jgi:hypothetical protein
MPHKITPIYERFMNKVKKEDNGCWIWTAFKDKDGYGSMTIDSSNKKVRSHRFSYCHYNNETITSDDLILHKCDNPSCVNPEHLFKGNTRDNVNDKVTKKRQASGEKCKKKLTTEIVKNIKKDLEEEKEN